MTKSYDIIWTNQPKQYCRSNSKKKKKRRKPAVEYLSFKDIDKMMRQNMGIDVSKCKGR